MNNHSLNETNSHMGSSGLLGQTKPRLQPMRVQELLDLCNSDDDDSEDKDKDSDSESDVDELQPLPDDEDEEYQYVESLVEEPEDNLSPVLEESDILETRYSLSVKENVATSGVKRLEQEHRLPLQHKGFQTSESVLNLPATRLTDNFTSEEQAQQTSIIANSAGNSSESVSTISQARSVVSKPTGSNRRSNVKLEMPEIQYSSEKSERFTDNFASEEQSQRKSNVANSVANSSECLSAMSQVRSVISKPAGSNRRSNVKLEMPKILYSSEKPKYSLTTAKSEALSSQDSNDKSKYAGVPVKSETLIYPSKVQAVRSSGLKFEAPDPQPQSVFYSNDRHLHPANVTQSDSSSSASTTVKSEALSSQESTDKSKYAGVLVKSDSLIYPSKVQAVRSTSSKIEAPDPQSQSVYYSNDRHLHPANVAQSDSSSSAGASVLQTSVAPSHLITDTPLKNNPPIGSSRPTPSMSHRSMFQTPQSSRLNHQDYSKNRVQTPATIFGNWSQNHMAQTPLQSRTTTSDSVRPSVPSILAQHVTSHDGTPWYRHNEDKDRLRRKPLGEAIHANQHSTEKSHATYTPEPLVPTKPHDSGDYKNRVVPEIIKDVSSKNLAVLGTHEMKENKHPRTIEKTFTKEEFPRNKAPDNIQELITACSNGTVNEIRSEPRSKVGKINISESQPALQNVHSSYSSRSDPTPVADKKNDTERKTNVQVSIPSSIRRPNHGETISVKDKDYLVLGTLGEGMSGQVLRVQDLRTRELRAIKIVDLSKIDRACAQGCVEEIAMLHKLQAPCVVRMFDYDIAFPLVHVVMEMGDTDFRSLLHSMSERKKLPLTMILYYWTEMLTAVKHIHDNGVIHSDLKPANFLLVRGRLKLIDFGIASSMNPDMTSVVKNSPIGTMNYISPESIMDIGDSPNKVKYKITFKSDVWSLGCILYSLIYGCTPFQHLRQGWAKLHAIMNPNPNISFPSTWGSDAEPLPPVLVDVMRKCLQHDPKARPTVAQLLQIPYVPTKQNASTSSADIPSDMLLKIKQALSESEWRQFTDIMEAKRNQC